jgi:histidinol-phosphatase (PHP family)
MIGLMDLHNHTTRCCHATGPMAAYVERAKALGLSNFGFSDHSHWMLQACGERLAMLAGELDAYVADVLALQAEYDSEAPRPFHVRLGMEMDFMPSRLPLAREIQSRYDWDYIIGSVHNIGFEKLQAPEMYDQWSIDDVCELYFHQLGMMVDERFCDIIAHIDLPKKMGRRPASGMLSHVESLIPAILAAGMAVEINTSGRDAPAQEFMPGWEVIEALAAAGVPLTLSSDAHAPHQVGRHFAEVLAGLRRLGVRELVYFEGRTMRHAPLDEIAPLSIPIQEQTIKSPA